jgi:hypothetical protein
METSGTLGTEDVYEMPFNEKNLKELVSLRPSDADIAFMIKDEASGKAISIRKESNINDTLKLFFPLTIWPMLTTSLHNRKPN